MPAYLYRIIIGFGIFLVSCTHGEPLQHQNANIQPITDIPEENDVKNQTETENILISPSNENKSPETDPNNFSENLETTLPNKSEIVETEEQLISCDFIVRNTPMDPNLKECYIDRELDWKESLIPHYADEDDKTVIRSAQRKIISAYKYRAEFVAGDWVLFDRDFSGEEHHDENLPHGRYKILVHKKTGIVKKRDYQALGRFLKSFDVLNTPAIDYYLLMEMVSAILDNNSYVVSNNNYLKFANKIKFTRDGTTISLDYWNMDNAGGYGFKEYFTHHILTIDKDYQVTEEKESFISTPDNFERVIHCFSAENCTDKDNIANYIVTPGSFRFIRKETPSKGAISPTLKKIIENNKKDETLDWCSPSEAGSEDRNDSVSTDCLIEFVRWNENYKPREPDENGNDNDIINAADQLFKRDYPTHVIFVADNWVLFDRFFLDSDPSYLAIPWGKYRTLVHTEYGVIKKNDLKSLEKLFADFNFYNNPFSFNHYALLRLIAAILDDNTEIISSENGIDWITKAKIKKRKKSIEIDYWNRDNSGEMDEFYTHHIITITKDYKITETRKTFDYSGKEIKKKK